MESGTPTTVVVVPVLGRPHRVKPFLDSLARATGEPHRPLFIVDWDDEPEIEALVDAGVDYWLIAPQQPKNYAAKINFGIRWSHEPLIFTAADDLDFHREWLAAAQAQLVDGVDVVGTVDQGNVRTAAGVHSTHTLVRRSYVEQFGTIDGDQQLFHEGYPHDYCDDEMIATAMSRGRYAHAFDSVVEHLHPVWGKAPTDATYTKGRAGSPAGKQLFESRRHLWEVPVG